MKKVMLLITAFVLVFQTLAFADVPDVAVLSDDELIQLIHNAYEEIAHRSSFKSDVILSRDGITVSRSDDAYVERDYLRIPVKILNETDLATTLVADGCIINGFTVSALAPAFAEPHSQVKTELVYKISEAECTTFEDVKYVNVKYYLEMKDEKGYSYNKEISELEIIP